jgi:hypothetical protein
MIKKLNVVYDMDISTVVLEVPSFEISAKNFCSMVSTDKGIRTDILTDYGIASFLVTPEYEVKELDIRQLSTIPDCIFDNIAIIESTKGFAYDENLNEWTYKFQFKSPVVQVERIDHDDWRTHNKYVGLFEDGNVFTFYISRKNFSMDYSHQVNNIIDSPKDEVKSILASGQNTRQFILNYENSERAPIAFTSYKYTTERTTGNKYISNYISLIKDENIDKIKLLSTGSPCKAITLEHYAKLGRKGTVKNSSDPIESKLTLSKMVKDDQAYHRKEFEVDKPINFYHNYSCGCLVYHNHTEVGIMWLLEQHFNKTREKSILLKK